MKMFKKLMAVALAGVMALTVLTGCAGTINKKEYFNVLSDVAKTEGITLEKGTDELANNVLSKVKDYAENHSQGIYGTVDQMAISALGSADIENEYNKDYAKIRSIVPDGAKEQYSVMWAPMDEYKSKDFQNMQELLNVAKSNNETLNELADGYELDKTATVSIASRKIGDTTFLVIVTVQAVKKAA